MNKVKRRATCIVECLSPEKVPSILVAEQHNYDYLLLPGGLAKRGEPRISAAIRELKEESKLSSTCVLHVFDFKSAHYHHKVFFIRSCGSLPCARDDVKALHYFPIHALYQLDTPDELPTPFNQSLAYSTTQILKQYKDWRQQHIDLVNALSDTYK